MPHGSRAPDVRDATALEVFARWGLGLALELFLRAGRRESSPTGSASGESVGVVTRPRADGQVGAVGYLYLHRAPRAVALLVRRPVAEAVNLAEVVDDLVVNAFEVADAPGVVESPAALFREQGD